MNQIVNSGLQPSGADGAPPTLALVLGALDRATDLPATRRRDWLSAVRSFCRFAGKRPDQIVAAAPVIRAQLASITPASAGISAKRLQNLKADLLGVLRHVGAARTGNTADFAPMSVAFEALWLKVRNDHVRFKLSRLFQFASARQLQPEQISDALLRDLLSVLKEATLTRDPPGHIRGAAWAWNRCRREIAGWPQIELHTLAARRGYTFKESEFPLSLQQDLKRWIARLSGTDLLSEDGPLRPLSPATLKHRAFQLRMVASAAVRAGVPMDRLQSIEALADPVILAKAIQWLIDRANGRRTEAMAGMAIAVISVARHHLKLPDQQLKALQRILRNLGRPIRGMRTKNRLRLLVLDDPRKFEALLAFSEDQLARAKRVAVPTRKTALMVQMAVAVEILLMTGIRLKNLTSLNVDQHLAWSKPGRRGTLHLLIDGSEVKNGELIMRELPPDSAKLIRAYIETYLPLLADQPTSFLFPGRRRRAKGTSGLSEQISRCLKLEIGIDMNPHLFRHFDAKLWLDANPGSYEVVRRFLGHTSINTTSQSYVGLESRSAGKVFDQVVLAHRNKRRRKPR